jgi:serine/threonine-protein kinase
MPLAEGGTFAGFTIVRLLDTGLVSELYLAQLGSLSQVLKVLTDKATSNSEFRAAFSRNAEVAATLSHSNIVRVRDHGEFQGRLWLSMDYLEGTDAGQLLNRRYPAGMPLPRVLATVAAVASALDYVHEHDLVHRDVKPENILILDDDGGGAPRILLTAFGTARQFSEDTAHGPSERTADGGTSYIAPEQMHGAASDPKTDQYELGATTFELLTGAPPAQPQDPDSSSTPPKISHRRPSLASLDDAISTAMATDPGDRFARCSDFADALRNTAQAADDDMGTEAALSAVKAAPQQNEPSTRFAALPLFRRPALVAAAAAVILLIAALIFVGLRVRSHEQSTAAASTTSATAVAPPLAGPTLDGTYQFTYDPTSGIENGTPVPAPPGPPNQSWWAYRSICTPGGCVATGTRLDLVNHAVALAFSSERLLEEALRFVDGHWVSASAPVQLSCADTNGGPPNGKFATLMNTTVLQPRPDSAFDGTAINTTLTWECGGRGTVVTNRFIAKRVGDVPASVPIVDPKRAEGISVSVPPTTPPPGLTAPRP